VEERDEEVSEEKEGGGGEGGVGESHVKHKTNVFVLSFAMKLNTINK